MTCGIYQIVNTVNGHIYIGSAVDFDSRKKGHWREARKGKHHSVRFQRAWDKYGESVFEFESLIECPIDLLFYYEDQFIKLGQPEYNMSKDAYSPMRGRNHTEESKQKMSESQKGNTYCLGYKHTDETKQKVSLALTGRPVSDETRRKIGNIHKGKPNTVECRRAISKGKMGKKRAPFTDKTKQRISNAKMGSKNPMTKFTDSDVIEIRRLYFSGELIQKQIALLYGVSHTTIHNITNFISWTNAKE